MNERFDRKHGPMPPPPPPMEMEGRFERHHEQRFPPQDFDFSERPRGPRRSLNHGPMIVDVNKNQNDNNGRNLKDHENKPFSEKEFREKEGKHEKKEKKDKKEKHHKGKKEKDEWRGER